jgi:outer membrane protein OmpA-like peptidoglycan-associated protein
VIEIRSHTDSRGDAARNKALSTERAKAVATYLNSKGISRKRLIAIGMGESQLVNNCTDGVICTEAEHQRNRRTEFRVIAIK